MASHAQPCPRCGGTGSDQITQTGMRIPCDQCAGSGRWVPDPSFGCALVTVLVLAVLAAPFVVVVVVTSWWVPLGAAVRSALETLLPREVVARTAAETGDPWWAAGAVLAAVVVSAIALSVARRHQIRTLGAGGSLVAAHAIGLVRVVVLMGGLGLALVSYGIAAGNDLRWERPEVYHQWWQIALVVVVALTWAFLGTGRLVVKRGRRR